jgi:hypothetical protein
MVVRLLGPVLRREQSKRCCLEIERVGNQNGVDFAMDILQAPLQCTLCHDNKGFSICGTFDARRALMGMGVLTPSSRLFVMEAVQQLLTCSVTESESKAAKRI